MRVFPSFPSRIPAAVAEFAFYDTDCIARVVADKPGGSKYRKRHFPTSSQPRGKRSDPSGCAAYFHLVKIFSSSLLLHQLSRHDYVKFLCAVTIFV